MKALPTLITVFLGSSLLVLSCPTACGQSVADSTEAQVWPEADFHVELPSHLRILAFSGVEQGVGYPYQQWYGTAALGYQFKPILRPHVTNIDPDKEFHFLFGGGYEFLQTIQSGKVTNEQRVTIDITPGFRLPAEFLVRDRNWIELRWMNGKYSTTYRNRVMVERDFLFRGFHFSPYGSAEIFYNGDKNSWNEEWYSAGIQWPYRHRFMLDTYYRRENCSTCTPINWNVAGVTLNFYFGETR